MTICKIKGLNKDERVSTQALLQKINQKIEEGVCEFEIEACGQHDIGGSCWSESGKNLVFNVTNPGQRVGAMGMEGTKIIVKGSAPADVGWLNSGAEIIIKGDAGDTAAHCAAGGKIYVGGRVGTRSGALMKHDPKFEQPEFWVLKNTGSFSFEFMGGGRAVVCGVDCENLESVLGARSCVGMVGGTVYVRGNLKDLATCVQQTSLDKFDKDFLKSGMGDFLNSIDKTELLDEMLDFSSWVKIIPLPKDVNNKPISVAEFKKTEWFKDGLFGDMVEDDGKVFELAQAGADARLRTPQWLGEKCIGCDLCLNNCPQKAIVKNKNEYSFQDEKCIGCGFCTAVCPCHCWKIE